MMSNVFGKLKLVSSAKRYWQTILSNIANLGQIPITLWDEIKEKLKEKYLLPYYLARLYQHFLNICQDTVIVTEYMTKFDEFTMQCSINEADMFTIF